MNIDLLVAEIGSTTTVINAFDNIEKDPIFIAQGQAHTTASLGDVTLGLKEAITDLKKKLGEDDLKYKHLLASSSAAGGLRMSVHGLVYDMTVKAAKEAALGAGANIKFITAGKIRRSDLKKLEEIKPNIILIAGGVDYGERETAIFNAEAIKDLGLNIPIIYAGNIENREEIELIFEDEKDKLYIVDNVYPRIDELNIEPTRKVIQKVFEENIVNAKGMEKIREMVDGNIIPTPGAVMEASMIIYQEIGDLVTVDIGGATTDVHSVCNDSDRYSKILMDPEPFNKRTVEGDLGMYVNRHSVFEFSDKKRMEKVLNMDASKIEENVEKLKPIPQSEEETALVEELALTALNIALDRHSGKIKSYYSPSGKRNIAQGKDLTSVKSFVATGGALTRLPRKIDIIRESLSREDGISLLPEKNIDILVDEDYIMASAGVISLKYKDIAVKLLRKSMKLSKGKEDEISSDRS